MDKRSQRVKLSCGEIRKGERDQISEESVVSLIQSLRS